MNGVIAKARTSGGWPWRVLRTARRWLLAAHVPVHPVTRPVLGALYGVHVCGREGIQWLLRVLWYEPLFRSQCESVGPGFRMERLPYISGRGRIAIGAGVRLSGKQGFCFGAVEAVPLIEIGDESFIGHECGLFAAEGITIGRRCLIAARVTVRDYDGHSVDPGTRRGAACNARPVVIGDEVWIGAGAVILKGVRIGDRAVVGAGAVVTRDVPADSVVAGNPARLIRSGLGAASNTMDAAA